MPVLAPREDETAGIFNTWDLAAGRALLPSPDCVMDGLWKGGVSRTPSNALMRLLFRFCNICIIIHLIC